jgi:hypothetical protein
MAKAPKRSTPSDSALVETVISVLARVHGETAARTMLAIGLLVDQLYWALKTGGWDWEPIKRLLTEVLNCEDFVTQILNSENSGTAKLDGPVREVRERYSAPSRPAAPRPEASQGRTIGTIMATRRSPPPRAPVTQLAPWTPSRVVGIEVDIGSRVLAGDRLRTRLLKPLADPQSPPVPAAQPAALPATRPKGLGPRAWIAAREVHTLTRERGEDSKWIDLDALLNTVHKRIGDKRLSKRTLNTALTWLRENRLLDR